MCVLTPPVQQLSTASVQPLAAGGDDWPAFLETVCRSAAVDKYSVALRSAAEGLGVALQSELAEVADDLARIVCMKPLEQRRFKAGLRA